MMKIHMPAADFSLPDLDGRLHTLVEQRGRIVVLNFWSAECPWAERADRIMAVYQEKWGNSVQLWSIASNANEPIELLRSVAQKRRLPLVLRDAGNQVADLYDARTTPQLFLVDQTGCLRYRGALDDMTFRKREPSREYLYNAVEALLNSIEPDPVETPAYGCTIVRAFSGPQSG